MSQTWLTSILLAFYCTIEMKTKSMIEAQTSNMTICQLSGGMLRSAWQSSYNVPNLQQTCINLCFCYLYAP